MLCYRCQVLDEMGDTSSEEERREHFQSVDVDQSDGVDFEEFLEVRSRHCLTQSDTDSRPLKYTIIGLIGQFQAEFPCKL